MPRLAPYGGSKWGRNFAGPCTVSAAGPDYAVQNDIIIDPQGRLHATADAAAPAETMMFLPAGTSISLGQFLLGALNLGVLTPPPAQKFCGAALTASQAGVLAKLGLGHGYFTFSTALRFAALVRVNQPPAGHYPGAHIKKLAALLRAPATSPGFRIAILPPHETEQFCLTNRASLLAWLRAKQISVIDPALMDFEALSAILASADLLLLADPAQAGLLGLCPPLTKILEIVPEGFRTPLAQHLAGIHGQNYALFFAAPPSYPLLRNLPFGTRVPLAYEIPIRDLNRTLESF